MARVIEDPVRDDPVAPPGPSVADPLWRRLWDRPLWAHLLLLGLVLSALLLVVRPQTPFSADEGAAVRQAVLLERGDGWTTPHPFPEADPEGVAYPLSLSDQVGDEFAPFAKHPLYAVVLSGVQRVGGVNGMVFLSVVGTMLAAFAGALVSRRLDGRLERPTLWLLGLGSPLLFDGYLVIAHTIAAALVTAALLVVLDAARGRSSAWRLVGLVFALGAAALLRNEAVIYAVALGGVGAVWGLRSRRRMVTVAAVLAGLTGIVVYRFEPWLIDQVLGRTGVTEGFTVGSSGNPFTERLRGFVVTWLLPSYGRFDLSDALLVAVVIGCIGTAAAMVTRPSDGPGIRLLASITAAAAVARVVVGPAEVVPGLLLAFPLLAAGALGLGRPVRGDRNLRALVLIFTLFSLGVIVTQYSAGGSGEWGGRYFALGLPTIVPAILFGLDRAGRRLDAPTQRTAMAAALLVCLSLSVLGLSSLRASRGRTAALVAAIDASTSATPAADGGSPVVVTAHNAVGRWAWSLQDDGRWLRVADEALGPYAQRLRNLGVGEFTFVARGSEDLADLEDEFQVVRVDEPIDGEDWIVAVLQAR